MQGPYALKHRLINDCLEHVLTTKPPQPEARAIQAFIERLQAQRSLEVAKEQLALEKTRLALVQKQVALGLCADLPPAPPPVTTRWWFWTILGAAAVGTAVTFAVAAQPPPGR